MAFLYCTYIVTYAITSPILGGYIDRVSNRNDENIHEAIRNVAGVQFTVICVLVMAATFIPKGALSFNPKLLSDEDLDHDLHDESEEDIDIFDMGSGSVDGSIMAKDPVIKESEGDARAVSRRHDKD
jgi:hypothetical protein